MRARVLAVGVAVALVAVACGNSGSSGRTTSTIPKGGTTPSSVNPNSFKEHLPVTAPGVTDTEIRVAAVLTETSPIGSPTASTRISR